MRILRNELTGLERLLPPHGPNPMDPQWLEFQRRYGNLPPGALGHHGGPSGSHIPGVYPPSSIASDLMQRERERLERLGNEKRISKRTV